MRKILFFLAFILSTFAYSQQAKVDSIVYGGAPAIRFSAAGYEALLLPSFGSSVIRLYHTPTQSDILHTPDSTAMHLFYKRPQIYGTPLLFPPNRIADGQYAVGDQVYRYPITIASQNCHHHGYLKSQRFELIDTQVYADSVVLTTAFLSDATHGGVYASFPHPFRCIMTLRLSKHGLEQTVAFHNLGDRTMPLGFGYHTPLRLPFQSPGDNYRLLLSAGEQWEVDKRFLPTKKRLKLTGELKKMRYSGMECQKMPIEVALSNNPLYYFDKSFNGAILRNHTTGISVFYEVDPKFIHWTLWNNKGKAPYVCPEPQSWVTNAPNLDLPASETGFTLLPAGQMWEATVKLYVR